MALKRADRVVRIDWKRPPKTVAVVGCEGCSNSKPQTKPWESKTLLGLLEGIQYMSLLTVLFCLLVCPMFFLDTWVFLGGARTGHLAKETHQPMALRPFFRLTRSKDSMPFRTCVDPMISRAKVRSSSMRTQEKACLS